MVNYCSDSSSLNHDEFVSAITFKSLINAIFAVASDVIQFFVIFKKHTNSLAKKIGIGEFIFGWLHTYNGILYIYFLGQSSPIMDLRM